MSTIRQISSPNASDARQDNPRPFEPGTVPLPYLNPPSSEIQDRPIHTPVDRRRGQTAPVRSPFPSLPCTFDNPAAIQIQNPALGSRCRWIRYQSSALPGASGESRDGGHGRDDGLGSLGLALREFLAFVLELCMSSRQRPWSTTADGVPTWLSRPASRGVLLTTFFTLVSADPASFPALQSSLLYPGPLTTT